MLLDRLHEERQTSVGHERILGLPSPIIPQVIFETPEADTVSAEEIACFEAVAPQEIDQKLIAVREEASLAARILSIQVAFEGLRYEAGRERVSGIVTKRPAFLKRRPQKMHSRDQGGVGRGGTEIDREEDGAHMAFQPAVLILKF